MYKFKYLLVTSAIVMLLASATLMVPLAHAANGQNTLYAGQTLTAGQQLVSQGGAHRLIMQGDGNFVEYDSNNHALWASGTNGNSGSYVINQSTDGNIVMYAPGPRAIWSTNTYGFPGTVFVLQSDANVVAYSGQTAIWARFGLSMTGIINQVFGGYGSQAIRVAQCESGLNPNAYNPQPVGNSHAEGLFQILFPSTWNTTSQANRSPYNPWANTWAANQIFVRDGYSWREWACKP